jgi:hypothetical protein
LRLNEQEPLFGEAREFTAPIVLLSGLGGEENGIIRPAVPKLAETL